MSRTHLSESSWPAQTDEPIWETTVGELLREWQAPFAGSSKAWAIQSIHAIS